jgi:hypothetical protein
MGKKQLSEFEKYLDYLDEALVWAKDDVAKAYYEVMNNRGINAFGDYFHRVSNLDDQEFYEEATRYYGLLAEERNVDLPTHNKWGYKLPNRARHLKVYQVISEDPYDGYARIGMPHATKEEVKAYMEHMIAEANDWWEADSRKRHWYIAEWDTRTDSEWDNVRERNRKNKKNQKGDSRR